MAETDLAAERVPELRDIRGPAALSGSTRRFWRLVWHLARTEFVLKYKGSFFGYVWSLLSPLLLFGVLYLAFTRILRFGRGVEDYASVLLLNLMLFQFFADSTSRAMLSIVGGEAFVRKMEFPRFAIPLSTVLASAFTLGLDLVVVVGYMLIAGVSITLTWLLFPVLILWLALFAVGASLLLSALYVYFRDTAQIWVVLTRVLFYASPILFPIELFPSGWKPMLLLNPLAPLFVQARVWIVDPGAPGFSQALGGAIYWIYPMLVLVTVVVLGFWVFEREAPKVAEQL